MKRDPFSLPPKNAATGEIIAGALECVRDGQKGHVDPRDIIKRLVQEHSAALTYPTYRTALRVGGIYSEAASSCARRTAEILLASFTLKAHRYLWPATIDPTPPPGA